MIIVDTREKERAIIKILSDFSKAGIEYRREKLDVGDYMNTDSPWLVVDRKQNLLEVAHNVGQDLPRFLREIQRAEAQHIKIVFLVEHGYNVTSLKDVQSWVNPRLKDSPLALSGERLYKKMLALQNGHNIEWRFCSKGNTGRRILKILEESDGEEG